MDGRGREMLPLRGIHTPVNTAVDEKTGVLYWVKLSEDGDFSIDAFDRNNISSTVFSGQCYVTQLKYSVCLLF